MSQDRLNPPAILNIEHELTNRLSYDDIIEDCEKKIKTILKSEDYE